MAFDVTISKNGTSVGIYAEEVDEELSNKLITLTLARTSTNQSLGAKETKIIDLLRITHQIVIRGYITASSTKTAKQNKDLLKYIQNGAGANGGDTTLSYGGDDYSGYIEKINFKEVSSDNPTVEGTDQIKYEVTINFTVGTGEISS